MALNSAIFIAFAFRFFKPQTTRDRRSFSEFSAFIIALFVEMYGFPLTIYSLSGWLQCAEMKMVSVAFHQARRSFETTGTHRPVT